MHTCYFSYNSAALPKDSLEKLDAWLKPFLNESSVSVRIAAYTDTIGRVDRNIVLARKRADAVRDHLSACGLKVDKATVIGEGYDLGGYTKDPHFRKVEITIAYQETAAAKSVVDERMEKFERAEEPVALNIQFVGGQDVYIGDSYLEVVALLQYLRKYPQKKAFIRGHVCCRNDMELSVRRAYAVYNDLIREGIAPDRLSYKGFGNALPLLPESDEYSRQQNRRVDVIFSE